MTNEYFSAGRDDLPDFLLVHDLLIMLYKATKKKTKKKKNLMALCIYCTARRSSVRVELIVCSQQGMTNVSPATKVTTDDLVIYSIRPV